MNNPILYTDPSGHCIQAGDAPPGSISNRNICPGLGGTTTIPTPPIKPKAGGSGGTTTQTSVSTNTPSPTQCSVVFIDCSFPSSTPTSYPTSTGTPPDGPAYVAGPTMTPTPTPTNTPIPKSTINPDDAAKGVGIGQLVADANELVKTGGQQVLSKSGIAVSFLIGTTVQWLADSNNGLGLSERAIRAVTRGVEVTLTGLAAGLLAGSIIVAGGGPENLVADVAAVLVFANVAVQADNYFNRLNEELIFPMISDQFP